MIKVLIADDHSIVRQGLKQILADTHDIQVTGEAGNGGEVMEWLKKGVFDVVVLDITMPGMGGVDILKYIRKEKPKPAVLVLSIHPEDQYAIRMIKAGAAGYLTKDKAPEELIEAIRKVAGGRKYITPSLAEKLFMDLGKDSDRLPHEGLSDREFEVLCLIASGKTVTEIGNQMNLSVKTISTYRSRILEKMGMKTNAELTVYAVKKGLV